LSGGKIFHFIVSSEQAGVRLDRVLAQLDFISSRSRAAWLMDRGLVSLQGKPLKASFKAQTGDQIQIELPPQEASSLQPLDAPLDVLFEDDSLVVLNKPAGLVVHPAAGHQQDTLVNILLQHIDQLSMGFAENRPGIVHRLDRDTSGILVVAKNDLAHHHLAEQFRLKTAHRIYWAIVHGVPKLASGTITSHLARHPQDRKRFASNKAGQGKSAITHYKLLQSLPSDLSWLQCKLETGRTHQIRVHLSESGHPIIADPIYGRRNERNPAPRLALHACELGFEHPRTHQQMLFRVGWPAELRTWVETLGFRRV
jgi:23S rRNA pseudouridine1911/1915/1917 synthase